MSVHVLQEQNENKEPNEDLNNTESMRMKMKELTQQLQHRDQIIAFKDGLIDKLMNDLKVMSERVESLTKKVLQLESKSEYEREFRLNQSDDSNSPPLQKK